MSDEAIARTAEYWDRYVSSSTNRAEWLSHPLVQQRLERQREGQSIEAWFNSKYLSGRLLKRGLGIGAGVASFELNLLQQNIVDTFDLYDVSQGSLDQAQETARTKGVESRVRCFCADVTTATFTESYDLITFISSLHHINNLEDTLSQMHAVLSDRGVLLSVEYVGPDRFEFPDSDLQLARRLYRALDPELKAPWPELPLPRREDVIAADPTEAIHSSAIIETLQRVFEHVEVTPFKTSLAFILWWGLNHDALFDTEEGIDLVRMILALDELLVDAEKMPNYFAYLAAMKTGFR